MEKISFFFLGFAGLVYEIIWQKRLVLILGTNAYSLMAILSVTMLGFSCGSFLFAHIITKKPDFKKKIYFWLLLFSALSSFLITLLLNPQIFSFNFPLRFILSLFLLLIPNTFFGGGLPVISKILINQEEEIGNKSAKIYALNNFGALFGIIFAGFFAIEFFGIKITAFLTSLILIIFSFLLKKDEKK
jgi:predicted membrane-bound spermidine synthase